MRELIRAKIEVWIKMMWLKTINRAIKKRDNLQTKLKLQEHVIAALANEYNKIYAVPKKNDEVITDNENMSNNFEDKSNNDEQIY